MESVVDFLHDNILKNEVKTNKSSAFPETSLGKRGSVWLCKEEWGR